MAWWQDFFDASYHQLWSHVHPPALCRAQAEQLVARLALRAGDRVLDAPCGYGRMTLPLARLGMKVTGVDYSAELLAIARQEEAEDTHVELRYLQADLRALEIDGEFDAAVHLFSSLGYGEPEDDLLVLANLERALRPGGALLLETIHRDAIVHRLSLGQTTGVRGPDGIILREKNHFDPIAGVIDTTWTWNSPTTSGSKHSRIRIYSATELVVLLQRAGFERIECCVALTDTPFSNQHLGERLGIKATKSS